MAFAVGLLDARRSLAAGLVEVFPVDALHDAVSTGDPVVAVDGDGELVADAAIARASRQPA